MNDSLPKEFKKEELLLRAVLPWPRFWNGEKLSSAALKTASGLSVDRVYNRTLEEAIVYMHEHLTGDIAAFTVGACEDVGAIVRYLPTCNIYHSEIHGSESTKVLSTIQAKELALKANIVFRVTATVT